VVDGLVGEFEGLRVRVLGAYLCCYAQAVRRYRRDRSDPEAFPDELLRRDVFLFHYFVLNLLRIGHWVSGKLKEAVPSDHPVLRV